MSLTLAKSLVGALRRLFGQVTGDRDEAVQSRSL